MKTKRSSIDRTNFIDAVRDRPGVVILVTVAAIVFSLVASASIPPIYEARAVFYLLTNLETPTDASSASSANLALPLSSRQMSQAYLGILRGQDFKRVIADRYPDVAPKDLSPTSIHFQNTSSGLMATFVRNQDPEKAARIANAFVSYFREFIQQPVTTSSERSREMVQEELTSTTQALDDAIRRRQDYLEQNNVSSVQSERQALNRRLLDLTFEKETLEIASDATRREIEMLETSAMRDRLALLTSSIDSNRAKVQGLAAAIRSTNAELQRLEVINETVAELNTDVDRLSSSKATLERTGNNMNLVSLQLSNVELIAETARSPESPVYPLTAANAVVSGVAGLIGGLLYAVFLGGLDARNRMRRYDRVVESGWAQRLLKSLPGV